MVRLVLNGLFFITVCLSAVAHANSKPVFLVEIASFDCPACKAVNEYHTVINQTVAKTGGKYSFAPVPQSLENSGRELFYYAAKAAGFGPEVRQAFFEAQGRVNMATSDWSRLKEWVLANSTLKRADIQKIMKYEDAAKDSLIKALSIVKDQELLDTPSFVFVSKAGADTFHVLGGPMERVAQLQKEIARRAGKND